MAHRTLFAKHGSEYLSPSEVVSRLRGEFRYVEVDLQQGDEHVKSMVEQLTRMQDLKPPPASSEEIERLKAAHGQALFVCIYDEPYSEDAVLTTTIIPNTPLFFGFSSKSHESATEQMLGRCAKILDYLVSDR